jgi:hypothetical protein
VTKDERIEDRTKRRARRRVSEDVIIANWNLVSSIENNKKLMLHKVINP